MRLLIASNREPLQRQEGGWRPSVGGLTTALLPLVEERGGAWVAWGEEGAEEEPTLRYPEDDPVLEVSRLALSEREVDGYFYGFANRALWPLCRYFIERTDLKRHVDEITGRINGAYMDEGWTPVHYHYRSHSQEELVPLYLAADAALVTPLRDGMNIVAQEFACVAERGALVLSELAGAAELLSAPFLVNPYDVHGMSETMQRIFGTPPEARREAMRGVRREVEELDIHGWGGRFLASLESA